MSETCEVETLADQIVELVWVSAEQAGWDEERSIARVRKDTLNKSALSAAFSGLPVEDQKAAIALVLQKLAARRAPRA
jgi:hypothetical protein